MAYDLVLAERIRKVLDGHPAVEEKKMFGGLSFLMHGNMACGITPDSFVVRVGPERYTESLLEPHVKEMDFTGRPMKGWVCVVDEGITADADLERWVKAGVEYALSMPPKR